MIFFRLRGKTGYKSHWRKIDGASTLAQGVKYVTDNQAELAGRGIDHWEVGCKVPPKDTPQSRRTGCFVR